MISFGHQAAYDVPFDEDEDDAWPMFPFALSPDAELTVLAVSFVEKLLKMERACVVENKFNRT